MTGQTSDIMKCVRLLCALALLLVGFAHKAPLAEAQAFPSLESSQYVFPDGSAHSLCLPGADEDGAHGSPYARSGCEACRLGASMLLPPPVDIDGWLIRLPADRFSRSSYDAPRRPIVKAGGAPRAPPVTSTPEVAVAEAAVISAHAG